MNTSLAEYVLLHDVVVQFKPVLNSTADQRDPGNNYSPHGNIKLAIYTFIVLWKDTEYY